MQVGGKLLEFNKPLTMGILNITDDSFYAGSRVNSEQDIIDRAGKMIGDGADLLDVGAYSTRPGADEIPEDQETRTLCEAIRILRVAYPEAIISADTFRAKVAAKAIAAGAEIINDVGSGVLDPAMFETVADLHCPYILMHNRGMPNEMNKLAKYTDLTGDIVFELSEKINSLHRLGVSDVIVDPGFGFSKTVDQNFELLERMDELSLFGLPILAGLSRKSMVWRTLNTTPANALNGTTALHMMALERGAKLLRVHDVKEAAEVIQLWRKLKNHG